MHCLHVIYVHLHKCIRQFLCSRHLSMGGESTAYTLQTYLPEHTKDMLRLMPVHDVCKAQTEVMAARNAAVEAAQQAEQQLRQQLNSSSTSSAAVREAQAEAEALRQQLEESIRKYNTVKQARERAMTEVVLCSACTENWPLDTWPAVLTLQDHASVKCMPACQKQKKNFCCSCQPCVSLAHQMHISPGCNG